MGIRQLQKTGFTIVELVVVISVIGLLASIAVVGYGAWQKRAIENVVKSDLKNISAIMESARNFGSGYPLTLPASFTPSKDVSLTYGTGSLTQFCINGTSLVNSAVQFYVNNSDSKDPIAGTCPAPTVPAPTIASTSLNGANTQVDWGAVSGVTSYEVQWRENGGGWTLQTTGSTSFAQSGRVAGVQYDYQVRSVASGGTKSSWSNLVSLQPFNGPTYLQRCVPSRGFTTVSWPSLDNTVYPYFHVHSNANGEDIQVENTLTSEDIFIWTVDDSIDSSNLTVQYVNPQNQYSIGTSVEFAPEDNCPS